MSPLYQTVVGLAVAQIPSSYWCFSPCPCLTGCQSSETSADVTPNGDKSKACGALTSALAEVVKQHFASSPQQSLSNRGLVAAVRAHLAKQGFMQNPWWVMSIAMPYQLEPKCASCEAMAPGPQLLHSMPLHVACCHAVWSVRLGRRMVHSSYDSLLLYGNSAQNAGVLRTARCEASRTSSGRSCQSPSEWRA
jgi:hypothetical protein